MINEYHTPLNQSNFPEKNQHVQPIENVTMVNPLLHQCAFCGDNFFRKHQNQKYCPEKFGREDFCRREQEKRLKRERDAVTNQKLYNIAINEAIISKIMNGYRVREILSDELKSLGYIDWAYNRLLKDNKVFYFFLENYVIKVVEFKKLVICKNEKI